MLTLILVALVVLLLPTVLAGVACLFLLFAELIGTLVAIIVSPVVSLFSKE